MSLNIRRKVQQMAKNVEMLWWAFEEAAHDFQPANVAIWDALFPNWPSIPVHIDLIVGFPKPYDAVTMKDAAGHTHIVLDLFAGAITAYPKTRKAWCTTCWPTK